MCYFQDEKFIPSCSIYKYEGLQVPEAAKGCPAQEDVASDRAVKELLYGDNLVRGWAFPIIAATRGKGLDVSGGVQE